MKTSTVANCRSAILIVFFCSFIINGTYSFSPVSFSRILSANVITPIRLSNSKEGNGVEAVSLDGLGDDHETVGESMAKSVAAWLDAEVSLYVKLHIISHFHMHRKLKFSTSTA